MNNMTSVFLLYIDKSSSDSKKAIKILRDAGVSFKVVEINESGVRGYLWHDVGLPSGTPFLVGSDFMLIGLESIKKAFNSKDNKEK